MQPFSVPVLPALPRIHPRIALVASADRSFRQRLTQILTGLRWDVREAEGGAEAWSEAEASHPEAVIVDSWLPDLDLSEFLSDFRGKFPGVDVVTAEGSTAEESPRGPYRQELLYALRRSEESDTASWNAAPQLDAARTVLELPKPVRTTDSAATDFSVRRTSPVGTSLTANVQKTIPIRTGSSASSTEAGSAERLPEMVGNAPCMLEVSRRVRLVAPRLTPVLIEGPTGSGKELVAEALHRLSSRSRKPFVAINCAAIPESLLEAELFGHTRGAFTGAVQGRTGRIEAADGGTLFLDEIGEMPLGLQSKLLRFVECGELQRVASNEIAFTQGSINSTGNSTDVALNGSGYFVVGNGSGGYEYSRAGNFSLDSNGALVTSSGANVMGYPAANGVVNTNAPLTAIEIPVGQVQEPKATTTMNMTANLNSTTAAGTTFPAQVTVYDSLGEPHVATVTFEPGAAANTWTYSVALPAADYSAAGADVAPAAITGTMTFNQSGNLIQVQPTGAAAPSTVGTAAGDVSSIALNFNPAATNVLVDGAAGLNVQWNLLGNAGTPTISQVDTASAVSATTQNGYASGQYKSFTIGSDGTVTASFSNGQQQNVGQLALANVTNSQGLNLLGNGNYVTTLASGTAVVGTSGTSGLAALQDDALEASNVNISTEFSQLIIAQRAFEANAKSVTTFDTVTQDTINMVH
jgi:flagellar hook protein FlgE